MDKSLDIIIWDVGHGSAASVRLPNGIVIMLDCGLGSAGFSPVRATLDLWKKIDGLIISHPHMDHTGDIASIPPDGLRLLAAPSVPYSRMLEGVRDSDLGAAESYMRLKGRFCFPFEDWGMFGDTTVESFWLGGQHSDMNEYSIVTFIRHGWFTLMCAGDLPADRWADLLDAYGVRLGRLLLQTNFFVIPHHGRRDAYSADLLGLLPNLQMGIISDGREVPTSVTPMYSRYFDGWPVWNANTKRREWRKILTTRNDGHVWLRVGISTDGACRTVMIGSRGRHG